MVMSMAVPRVTWALASQEAREAGIENGPLFFFSRLHPRFGSPANAVLLQTAMALIVLTLGAFDNIMSFIIFSAVVFLALTVTTLFRIGRKASREGDEAEAVSGPVRGWWYPVAPIVFLIGSGVLALMLLMHDWRASLLGAGIVLLGLPVRWLLVRRTTPDLVAENVQ
jgi:APA family basic amino acid/polyamine antiporter